MVSKLQLASSAALLVTLASIVRFGTLVSQQNAPSGHVSDTRPEHGTVESEQPAKEVKDYIDESDKPPESLRRVALGENGKKLHAIATPNNGCPTNRFLYFGNANGRHSNQVRALIHALHFGAYTNRTVVVPPFKQDKRTYTLDELYDYSLLSKHFCLRFEHEVFTKEITDVGCLERKGIPNKMPRRPQGLKCQQSQRMVTRDIAHVVEVAKKLASYTLLYMYETNYYKDLSPACFWKYAEPSAELLTDIESILKEKPLVAVHLRGLESSCKDRLTKMMKKSGMHTFDTTQCDPSSVYIKGAFEAAGIEEGPVYLADDGQRPSLTNDLRANIGKVLSYSSGSQRFNGLKAMLVDFWILVKAPIFLPNQASSLSTNARNKRVFMQHTHFAPSHGCYNWQPIKQDSDPEDLGLCN